MTGTIADKLLSLRAKYNRAGLFAQYSNLCRAAGFDRLYFVLSFDCDTDEDIGAVPEVHERLAGIGVTPTYAASGPILQKGCAVFEKLASAGVEFINHGFSPHAFFNEQSGRYESSYFYDTLSFDKVAEDIEKGGELVKELTGVMPSGFRAPHFGTFQKPHQISFLHSTLSKLGYRFSSSTMPSAGFRHGAVNYIGGGVAEIPVSGMWSRPLSVLDTWEFLKLHNRKYSDNDYRDEASSIASEFEKYSYVGLLNYYADPSHVAGKDVFFDVIKLWKRIAQPVSYKQLLDMLEQKAKD